MKPSVCAEYGHGYENENRFPFDISRALLSFWAIRSGGLVYAYTSLQCGAVDIIRLWLSTNCTCFEPSYFIFFLNAVGLPLVYCSASLACLSFGSFCSCCYCCCCCCCIRIALRPEPNAMKSQAVAKLLTEGIQCKICLSMYNITYHSISSTPFRSQRQNLNRFIFSNIRNRNQNQCVCM